MNSLQFKSLRLVWRGRGWRRIGTKESINEQSNKESKRRVEGGKEYEQLEDQYDVHRGKNENLLQKEGGSIRSRRMGRRSIRGLGTRAGVAETRGSVKRRKKQEE